VTIGEAPRNRREELRLPRKDLVLEAERVVQEGFARGRMTKPKRTQLSNLIGLCNEAQCVEEIANYLRYQAGRGEWDRPFADAVIAGIEKILKDVVESERIAAWKLYATYLTRAYVYQDAIAPGGRFNERSSR
jgi:hypothetical protein